MRNQENGPREIGKHPLESLNGVGIEMIRQLIEHKEVRIRDELFSEHELAELVCSFGEPCAHSERELSRNAALSGDNGSPDLLAIPFRSSMLARRQIARLRVVARLHG